MDNILYVDILVLILIVRLFWLVRGLMKFALHIYSIGMHHQDKNSIKHQENMLKIFICLIQEEEIDVFLIGVFKVEFHSLIHKL